MTHDGPGVQGGSITFKAEVHPSDDFFPITSYTYIWRDDGMGDHKYEVNIILIKILNLQIIQTFVT